MRFEEYAAIGCAAILGCIIIGLIIWKAPKRFKHDTYRKRWIALQSRCSDKAQWSQAIIEADDLLDEALRKKRYKGKTAGERLVEAQRDFANNDAVWFGHKLRTRIDANPTISLRKQDVQKALIGLRDGLKDIGALK